MFFNFLRKLRETFFGSNEERNDANTYPVYDNERIVIFYPEAQSNTRRRCRVPRVPHSSSSSSASNSTTSGTLRSRSRSRHNEDEDEHDAENRTWARSVRHPNGVIEIQIYRSRGALLGVHHG